MCHSPSSNVITWTNVDLSSKVFCDIHLRAMSLPEPILTYHQRCSVTFTFKQWHYLNQYWLIIKGVLWHSPSSNDITWTNIDLSSKVFCDIHLQAMTLPEPILTYHQRCSVTFTFKQCHYLNQCWLISKGVLWHSPSSNVITLTNVDLSSKVFCDIHLQAMTLPEPILTYHQRCSVTFTFKQWHYLNQYWLIIKGVPWHSPSSNVITWTKCWIISKDVMCHSPFSNVITWTNVDLSSKVFCDIHLRAMSLPEPILTYHQRCSVTFTFKQWHYLNQYWLIIKGVLWHSPSSNDITWTNIDLSSKVFCDIHLQAMTLPEPILTYHQRCSVTFTFKQCHYLNQCWLISKGDLWHSPSSNVITLTNVDLSAKVFCDIHLRTMSQKVGMNLLCSICLELTL